MSDHDETDDDDAAIAALLRSAGTRADPPADMAREVQAVVHAEWQRVVAERRRRRTFVWAAAASLCAVAIGTVIAVRLVDDTGQPLATLQRTDGDVFVRDQNDWVRVAAGRRIAVGESVRSEGRAALAFDNGLAVRLDKGTAFEMETGERLALRAGAVYVDANPDRAHGAFSVSTPVGDVKHVGTQYLVRMHVDGIEVSVREGRVTIDNAAGNTAASAGERVEVSSNGEVRRGTIAPTAEQWRWAREVAPPFAIENASLAAFLEWTARESGRALVYASAQAQAEAAEVTLHGSIEGLAPDVALEAVLATTPLRRAETNAETIQVDFATSIDSQQDARPTP
jgi:ferric-dicitrate binding protein FerR (iron transport regulator)